MMTVPKVGAGIQAKKMARFGGERIRVIEPAAAGLWCFPRGRGGHWAQRISASTPALQKETLSLRSNLGKKENKGRGSPESRGESIRARAAPV